jgi:hypothetical protein
MRISAKQIDSHYPKYGSSPKELAMIEGFKGPRVQGFKGK